MDQKITIKIAERKYALSASSPEKEALIRTAAEGINKKLETLSASMPGRSELDKITMIALNLSITSLSQQREIEAVRSGIDKLTRDTENYLENMIGMYQYPELQFMFRPYTGYLSNLAGYPAVFRVIRWE